MGPLSCQNKHTAVCEGEKEEGEIDIKKDFSVAEDSRGEKQQAKAL